MNLTALVLGATGATGKELLASLLLNPNYKEVKVFVRKAFNFSHPKLSVVVVDFDHLENYRSEFKGDVLFSALGTTLKQAGSQKEQYKVDVTYQYEAAKLASEGGVATYVLVSSYGANSKSHLFYPKMKGQLEDAICQLPFQHIHIFQPGILERPNSEDRFFEQMSVKIMGFLSRIGVLESQKPMPVRILAEAMLKVAEHSSASKVKFYKLSEIFKI